MVLANKKGSSNDVVLIGILVFVIGLLLFVTHFIFNAAVDSIISTPAINSSAVTVSTFTGVKTFTENFDYVIIGLFIALSLGLLITGWLVGGVPIFMTIYFIIVVMGVLLSAVLSYVWGIFTTASVFNLTINSFPMANHLLSNLQIYVAIVGVIGLLVMFGKPYFSGESGI